MATCRCGVELPGRRRKCDDCKAGRTPTAEPESAVPAGLADRGTRLWESLGRTIGTPAGELALEACRVADRLERMDALLRGDRWVDLIVSEDDGEARTVIVVVDKALAEARQQEAALLALLTKLGIEKSGASEVGPEEASPLAQVLALVQSGAKHQGGPA